MKRGSLSPSWSTSVLESIVNASFAELCCESERFEDTAICVVFTVGSSLPTTSPVIVGDTIWQHWVVVMKESSGAYFAS
jgi:hypothetical protein